MFNKEAYKGNKADKCIYIFFEIYMATILLGSVCLYVYSDILYTCIKIIRYICYLAFGIRIIWDWKNGSSITLPIIFIAIMSILISIYSNNKGIIILLLCLTALRNLDIKKILKITLIMYAIIFISVILLSLLKIIPNWTYSRGETIRYSLGFNYPTIAIGTYLSIILMYFYIRKSNCKFIELFLLEIVNIFLYFYTDGRLSFILISIILATMFLAKFKITKKIFNNNIIQKIVKINCYIMPILISALIGVLIIHLLFQ